MKKKKVKQKSRIIIFNKIKERLSFHVLNKNNFLFLNIYCFSMKIFIINKQTMNIFLTFLKN